MFDSLMHIAFFTDRMDEMIRFYTETLGGRIKVLVRYREYLDRDDRPQMKQIALEDPERIFNVYIEVTPGQFIELFPENPGQKRNEAEWNSQLGYSHFSLTVKDIHETEEELEKRGLSPLSGPSKGPSGTYQMWYEDPDGNRFEVMQYTEDSYQVRGHIDV